MAFILLEGRHRWQLGEPAVISWEIRSSLLAAGLWNSSIPLPGSSYLLNKCDARLMCCREWFMTFTQQKRVQAGVERR